MEYRKDIQMLRGIAVLLVVFFHLDLAGFRSGFLGVDVFFVISGYLMAMLYNPARKFEFFVKRARRLLPAYFAVVIVTLALAVFRTTPNDYGQVAGQAAFAGYFASNIGFWMENSYFDKAAFKPLLHLWSLGVEIQFYLLLPLLYGLCRRWPPLRPLLLLASALLCFAVVGISPKTAFFWLPFRLWEFLIGFSVARWRSTAARPDGPAWLGAAALLAIVGIPLMQVDGTALGFVAGHPGLFALLVSLATATTLAVGIPARVAANPLADLLERIGTWSYSIYLAHFPVIVLFLYQPFAGTVIKPAGLADTALLAVLVIAASALLYRGVEQPFRTRGQVLRWSAVATLAVLALSHAGVLLQARLIPASEMPIYQAWFDRDDYRCGKLIRIVEPGALSCAITAPQAAPARRLLLVGDSHADSIKSTFAAAAEAHGVTVRFLVGNTPLLPGGIGIDALLAEAAVQRIDGIVLHYSPGALPAATLEQLAGRLAGKGIGLALILPVPVREQHIPALLWRQLRFGEAIPPKGLDDYRRLNAALLDAAARIGPERLRVHPVAEVFCRPDCRLVADDGRPLYFDAGHLTLTGSALLRGVFERVVGEFG